MDSRVEVHTQGASGISSSESPHLILSNLSVLFALLPHICDVLCFPHLLRFSFCSTVYLNLPMTQKRWLVEERWMDGISRECDLS